ncbi:hypothetical protein [Ruficoccus sp. ZRK36]|uniref:hypothetical protein n=1 Tax=Ruficoccus sp. ZRK36 TaxID=2866311 RepID=UPI001C72DECC|nr:hypothetical protein [Ruficoccus sp. ZRK36]QYY35806.1 hypothetical protein K0V07_16090 [Ruficoccus sp. ZRK36]
MGQLSRALVVMRHLKEQGPARFEELVALLSPVSRTTVSALLDELEREGEVEHRERLYLPGAGSRLATGTNIYALPTALRAQTHPVLVELSARTGHASALFARVGVMTMKILDEFRPVDSDWQFSPAGYEWPLVPFHGFAKIFIAYAEEGIAKQCHSRWWMQLRPELYEQDWSAYERQLRLIRKRGYALEYQEENSAILRLAVPVMLSGQGPVCFSVGLVARFIYLLDVDAWQAALCEAADALREILDGRVPAFRFTLEPRSGKR